MHLIITIIAVLSVAANAVQYLMRKNNTNMGAAITTLRGDVAALGKKVDDGLKDIGNKLEKHL